LPVQQGRPCATPLRSQVLGHSQKERSIPGTNFDELSRWAALKDGLQFRCHDLRIPHPRVQSLKIPPRLFSTRIVGRQLIQQLGFQQAIHEGCCYLLNCRFCSRALNFVFILLKIRFLAHSTFSNAP